MKLKRIGVTILLSLIALLSVSCSSIGSDPVSQVMDAINQSEYKIANEIYNEEILGNYQLEKDVESGLTALISSAIDDFNNDEITYEEAVMILECIEKAEIYNIDMLQISYAELDDLSSSKESYELALTYEENGNYLEAYEFYEEVSTADVNYDVAQTKIDEVLDKLFLELMTEAEEEMAAGNYGTAFKDLYSYGDVYSDYEEYRENLTEELMLIWYTCLDVLIADAEALAAEGLYSDAYNMLLNEYTYDFDFSGNELYESELNKVYSLWEEAVIKEASEAFGNDKDYEAAILVLQQSGLTSENINTEIAKYQEYIPILLTSMEYTQKAEYISVGKSTSTTDVQGNVYDSSGIICPSGYWGLTDYASSDDEAYVTYYLNGEYTNLTGILYRPYITLSFDSEWSSSVKIYGDGVLLYETTDITSDTYEILEFAIDVTGVRELKIVMRGVLRESLGWVGMYDYYPRVCMADIMVSK